MCLLSPQRLPGDNRKAGCRGMEPFGHTHNTIRTSSNSIVRRYMCAALLRPTLNDRRHARMRTRLSSLVAHGDRIIVALTDDKRRQIERCGAAMSFARLWCGQGRIERMGRTMKERNLQGQGAFAARLGRANRRPPSAPLNEPFRRQFSKRGQEADGLDASENSLMR
jgi:hypothetical protein